MDKIQLTHPAGKKAISMDKEKYETLKASFLACLKTQKPASFDELLTEVEKDLKKRKIKVEGKLEWNLFWVTLDLEAKNELCKDGTVSPYIYTLAELV